MLHRHLASVNRIEYIDPITKLTANFSLSRAWAGFLLPKHLSEAKAGVSLRLAHGIVLCAFFQQASYDSGPPDAHCHTAFPAVF